MSELFLNLKKVLIGFGIVATGMGLTGCATTQEESSEMNKVHDKRVTRLHDRR